MLRLPLVLLFVAVAILSWGLYGPVLHEGQIAMDHSLLRPFVGVGVAYFLIAVLAPVWLLRRRGETGRWTTGGAVWSFLAGAAGAIGALGIIVAFKARGSPVYVMPLVFGCAPVVNTFVTMWMTKTAKQAGTLFYAGVLLVAVGAAGVLFFKPQPPHTGTADTATRSADKPAEAGDSGPGADDGLLVRELVQIIAAVALTALCWGCYGPLLHKGQTKMAGSRLRPFLCVGIAYFVIAVLVPLAILLGWTEPGAWSLRGAWWSLGAGAVGAFGALGVIMAFNFGGRPVYVMPLVFGGAPLVNTLTSVLKSVVRTGSAGPFHWMFYVSLLLVLVGAVFVLIFSPKPSSKQRKTDRDSKQAPQASPEASTPATPETAAIELARPVIGGEAEDGSSPPAPD